MDQHREEQHFVARREHRQPVEAAAMLRHLDDFTVEVRIRDVSTTGFMAECDDSVRIGSFVALDVPGVGAVSAQVRWQIGATMGGQFTHPISLTACEWTAIRREAA